MPIHDWTRVEDGIFHDFHHSWVEEIKRALNAGLLPRDYYALSEQRAIEVAPDILTLKTPGGSHGNVESWPATAGGDAGLLLADPKVRQTAESDADFYFRKQDVVTVRHISGDELIAVVEIVSPGNKSSRGRLEQFLKKASALVFEHDIHLLIVDLHPPPRRDPQGIHGVLWEYATGQEYVAPEDKPLTLVSYEANAGARAFIEPVAVGDTLVDMPLFLRPRAHVSVPLEATYNAALAAVPRRWRDVLQPPT